MNAHSASRPPPAPVLREFGASGPAVRLAREAWRCGALVLKPASGSEAWLAWERRVLAEVPDHGFRLQRLVRASDGSLVVDGWMCRTHLEGAARPGAWPEILRVGDALNEALAAVPERVSLPMPAPRADAWASADRMAWEEEPMPPAAAAVEVRELAQLRRPVGALPQAVHGDLTGNVLFAPGQPPAIIDFSPYRRPAAYALGVVVADAIVWHDAPLGLAERALAWPDGLQCLLRALLFRHLTALLLPGAVPRGAAGGRYAGLRRWLVDAVGE